MGLLNPQKPFFLEIVLVTDTKAFKVYDVTNHLKKFEYSLVSEDGGGLTYTIDVINPLEAVEELIKEYHANFYGDIEQKQTAGDLPKILIQWGYGKEKEDGISKVHLAALTDLKYTFSSGREKMLSITAVGDASFMNRYTEGLLRSQWRGETVRLIGGTYDVETDTMLSVEKAWKFYTADYLNFGTVIETLLGQHLAHYPLTQPILRDISWEDIDSTLRKMFDSYVSENTKGIPGFPYHKARSTASKEAAFKILEYFGFDVQLRTFKEDFKSGYYKVVYSKIGPGGVGDTKTEYFSKDQLSSGASDTLDNLKAARDAKVGGQPLNHVAQKSDIDFPEDLDFDPDAAGLTYTVISTPDEITTQSGFFTGTKSHVRIRSSNGHEFGASLGTAGSGKLRTSKLKRDKLAIQEDTKYQKLVTDAAGLDRDWKASAPKRMIFEDLSDDEKLEFQYNARFLQVSWGSPEGIPLKTTISDLLGKINSILTDPENHLFMYIQSPTLFEERGKKTLGEVYKEFLANPKTTILTVTQRRSLEGNADMEIFSFPQLNIKGEPFNNSRFTYGGNDSTVRFFDFTSDLAYMTQSIQGVKDFLGMKNNASLLTHDRLTKSLFYFVDKLTDSDNIIEDEAKRERIRSSVSLQRGHDRTALEINEETLAFLTSLGSTIKTKKVRRIFSGAEKSDVESFKAFIRMLQNKAALSSFFHLQGGKHASNYEVVFGSDSETFNTNSDIAYTLRKGNIYDQFSSEGLKEDQVLKVFVSDYLRGYPVQVRVKSLGIPELDTIMDVNNLRSIVFDVHDLSKERITGVRNIHWLSGTYTPYEIKHSASPSEGYLTELSLLRNNLGTSKREDNNE